VPHLCTYSYDQEHFESASGFVRAREKVSLGSLLIHAGKKVDFAKHNPVAAREIFIREGLLAGMVRHGGKAVDKFNALREKLLDYEIRMRKAGYLYDEEHAAQELFKRLPAEAVSAQALKELSRKDPGILDFKMDSFSAWDVEFVPEDYPDKLEFAGVKYPLHYAFEPGENHDGAMICAAESAVNLLPDTALAYPVPGYYADFAEVLLRSLPKDIRRNLGGIPQCAALFAGELKRDPSLKELPPGEVLADFLAEAVDIEVNPRVFDGVQMPEYLQMKLALLNENGKLKSVLHELPERSKQASRLSARMPGADAHRASGWKQWEASGGVLPEKVELPPGSGRCRGRRCRTADPQCGCPDCGRNSAASSGTAGKCGFLPDRSLWKHPVLCRTTSGRCTASGRIALAGNPLRTAAIFYGRTHCGGAGKNAAVLAGPPQILRGLRAGTCSADR
jgi:ATP-dependent helicase HrpA